MSVVRKMSNDKVEPLFSAPQTSDARRARAWLDDRIEQSKSLPPDKLMHEQIEITPVLAEIMLEHNQGNRPLKPRRFIYAEAMRAGEWKMHSQCISFARDGRLNNGQNRLTAVVLAGRPVKMDVAFGEERDVFPVIDTGGPRGGSDSLHIAGYKNTAALAAAARLLKTVTSRQPRGNPRVSNDEILRIAAAHPGLEDATTYGQKVGNKLRGASAAAPTVAFYMIASKSTYARRLDKFVELLAYGNVPNKRDPVLVLRDAIMNKSLTEMRSGTAAAYICASIILSWNLWVRGRKATLASIRWDSTKLFPKPE